MNNRRRENDMWADGLYIEKIADLTLCDLWHWHKSDFLRKFTLEDKFAIIENNSLKKIQLSKASCTLFLLHIFVEILYWHHIASSFIISTWVVEDYWLPSIIWGADFVLEISIVGNSFESFVLLVASHYKRVHFRLKPTPFHSFLSLNYWKWPKSMRH